MMKLYTHPISGHAHRARLFISLLELEVELIELDLSKAEHKAPQFLKLNAFGQIPVLEDEGHHIPDSNAIMIYLAKKHERRDWYPEDPLGAAQVQRWLSIAAGPLAYGPAAARLVTIFGSPYNPEEVIKRAHLLLKTVDGVLQGKDWLVGARPTIADVSMYSYLARAPEGNVELSQYKEVLAYLERIEALPGFVPFIKSPVGLNAATT